MERSLLKRPTTAAQVVRCLIWRRWHPAIAFHQGSAVCRRLDAKLIRRSIAMLRQRPEVPREVRALIAAVDVSEIDAVVQGDWLSAIDGLRVLFHASPVGTKRQRELLLAVARNSKLVVAMRVACVSCAEVEPTWAAVFLADGTPESLALVERWARELEPHHARWLEKLEVFRGALSAPANE